MLTLWAQWGPTFLKALTLTDYSPAFTGIVPKFLNSSQVEPSVVLNELTQAPFEPMKETDVKPLTLKIAFLLALASSKRCSEIHANKVYNLGQWEKVTLFPSSDFIAKNQLDNSKKSGPCVQYGP